MPYTTRHGFGYTVFEYTEGGIYAEMRVYVATDAPVKFVAVKLRNDSGRTRRLSVTGFFELVLGDRREAHAPHVVTEVGSEDGSAAGAQCVQQRVCRTRRVSRLSANRDER